MLLISNELEVCVRVLAHARVPEEIARHVSTYGDPRGKFVGRPGAKDRISAETGEHGADALVELKAVDRALVFALRGEETERDVHQVESGLDVEFKDPHPRALSVDGRHHQGREIKRRSRRAHIRFRETDVDDQVVDSDVVPYHSTTAEILQPARPQ